MPRKKERGMDSYPIFLTANDQESDMIGGYEAGGADYITKPFSIAVLTKNFTPKEYRILFLFIINPRIILTKRQLLEKL